ncbi:hypothetical protein ACHAXT_012412 [Thalassiosira profunda]
MATASKAYAASFEAQGRAFRAIYYAIAWIQALTVPLFLSGQTTCIFFYDLAASWGLQEPADEIGPSMHQVNRAFGVGDSLIQIPLLISSAIGLSRKKRWALICTAASGGIHLYWTTTVTFILKFMDKNDIDVWKHEVPTEVWAFIAFYFVYGVLALEFLYHFRDTLMVVTD